ncbi:MAG TPA: glucokinase [Acetobacteraceae bacterium]|jgi:glucokinase|nr:glucokinase [Acetobacteraceae bacterium]
MLIAGDIGGTKTLLAFYTEESGPRNPTIVREFPSGKFAGLADVVRAFLEEVKQPVTAACFDVAGPVIGGRAHLTNLPWLVDEAALARDLGLAQVSVINDLKAVAYAVPHLQDADLRTINEGKPEPHGTIGIIAPGTGLGEAFLIWSGNDYIPCASEGGHADFGPADPLQVALRDHLARKFGHVAYERVCSGSAIPEMYEFLRATKPEAEPPGFAAKLAAAQDRTPLIVAAAMQESAANRLALATVDLFVSILGAEAGNLALKVLATGGVYLAGGMPPRVLSRFEAGAPDGRFMRAFTAKGRLGELLGTIPVKVIVTRSALFGAALYGLAALRASPSAAPR